MKKFDMLFQPGTIGKLKTKNRIIKAPMYTGFGARDCSVSQQILNYYKDQARGGAGLVIVEYSYVDNKGSQSQVCQLGINDRSFIPGLSNLARIIKDNGAKVGIQLCHCGRRRRIGIPPIVSPSRIPTVLWGDTLVPDELTIEDIREIVESFGKAAKYAEQAGYDMVEVHGAHGYLLTEFLSPYTNRRNDIYGGNLQDRMRFLLEIIENIRQKVSCDLPVGMRINGTDYLDGGSTLEDAKVLAKELENVGLDFLHVSSGTMATISSVFPMFRPAAFNVPFAEEIKKVVDATIIVGGAISTPEIAEEVIKKNQADFVTLARPMLADPFFAKKAEEGRPEDIAPCIRCNDGCLARGMALDRAVTCTVNFTAGFEGEYPMDPVDEPKKVAVIGGGPGGMEAARVAALRGHDVTLYEARDNLGGYMLEASVPEFKKDIRRLTDYLSTQMSKLSVKVILKTKASAEMIKKEGFDVVILATGSEPSIPDIYGLDKKSALTAVDVLRGAKVGNNVIVAGGGMVGCEVGLYLAEQGKRVEIIEELEEVGLDVEQETKKALFEGFTKCKVKLTPRTRLMEVTKDGVIVLKNGKKQNLKSNSVVIALGFKSKDSLLPEVETLNIPVCTVGDCVAPRRIYDAIHEGFSAGYHI